MEKYILKHYKFIEDSRFDENDDFPYKSFGTGSIDIINLGIIKSFFEYIFPILDWAEVDLFAKDFQGRSFRTDCVFIELFRGKYYLGYSFERVPFEECLCLSKKELACLMVKWQEALDKKSKYVVLIQRDTAAYDIELKEELAKDEQQIVDRYYQYIKEQEHLMKN